MCDIAISTTAPAAQSNDNIGDLSVDGDATNDDVVMEEPTTRKRKKRSDSIKISCSSDSETDLDNTVECTASKKRRGRPSRKSVNGKAAGKQKAKKCRIKPISTQKTSVDAGTQTDIFIDAVESQGTELNASLLRCVKALLLPVSVEVHGLQKELGDLKMALTQLSSSIATMTQSHSSKSREPIRPDRAATEPAARGASDRHVDGNTDSATDVGAAAAAAAVVDRTRDQDRRQSQRQSFHNNSRRSRHNDTTTNFNADQLKQDVMASMYIDMDQKQRRATNIVVSGIPYGDDFNTVTNLLAEEFDLTYIPTVSSRRIGRPAEGRVQPLLVTMETRQDADYFIANARYLRDSYDPVVRERVYISADLTPAESKAAFEMRCRRRRNMERGLQQQTFDQTFDQSADVQHGRH